MSSPLFRRLRLACAAVGCVAFSAAPRCDPEFPRPFALHVASGREGAASASAAMLLNTGVYFAWQLPYQRVRGVMDRWFLSWGGANEGGRAMAPRNVARALLSSISHRSVLHLACNMLGVASFAPPAIDGAESILRPKLAPAEFAALWVAAGTASALASSAFSARFGCGAAGLGASGVLFSLLSFHALSYPESRVLLLFVFEMTSRDGMALATCINGALVAQDVLARRGLGACPRTRVLPPVPVSSPVRIPTPTPPRPFPSAVKPPSIDGMAHLVGTACGVAAFAWARERARRRRKQRRVQPSAALTIQRPPGSSARV